MSYTIEQMLDDATAEAAELRRERAEYKLQLIECRKRCEHMKTLEGLSIDELNIRLMAAKEQLEFDRTQCATVVTEFEKVLGSRFWLMEGRGSYEWNDDRYRQEFSDAMKEILAAVAPIRGLAINMASRLESTDQVIQARLFLKAKLAEAEKDSRIVDWLQEKARDTDGGYWLNISGDEELRLVVGDEMKGTA